MQKRNSWYLLAVPQWTIDTWLQDWPFLIWKRENNFNEVGIFNDAYFDVIGNTDEDR